MAAKKNKKSKKPAVGNSAAGSNNKRDKNKSQKPQNANQKKAGGKNTAQNTNRKQAKPANNNSKKSSEKKQKEIAVKREKIVQQSEKKTKASKEKKVRSLFQKIKKSEQDTAASIEKFKKEYDIRKIAVALILVTVIIAGIVFGAVDLAGKNYDIPDYVKDIEFKGRTEPESVAFDMDISENQQKALSKATKSKGDRNAFSFFVNDSIVMYEYDEPALIEFGSVDSNDCILIFFLFDEDGNEIYRSLGIEPGEQVKSVNFFDEIPYGSHELTLAVMGYDIKTYKNTGMQTAKINLEIGVG